MSNWLSLCLMAVLAISSTSCEDESPAAKLLFSKQILNKYLVEGMDVVIKYVVSSYLFQLVPSFIMNVFPRYSLFNVGSAAALDVQLTDNTFSPQDFEVVGGQLQVAIGRG